VTDWPTHSARDPWPQLLLMPDIDTIRADGRLAHDLVHQSMPKTQCLGLNPPNAHRTGELVALGQASAGVRALMALLGDEPTLLGSAR
jgi:hypothetical protein